MHFPRLIWLMVWSLFLAAGMEGRAEERVTVTLELSQLQRSEVLKLVRAILPEPIFGEAVAPDLPTLLALQAHFPPNMMTQFRHEEGERRWTQGRLEYWMREALKKIDVATLRRMALGDGKEAGGDQRLMEAFCHEWIVTEVARVCAQPGNKPVFPAEAPPVPERFRYLFGEANDTASLQRALGPFTKLLTQMAKKKPRGTSDDPTFYEMKADFLAGRKQKVADELLEFEMDGFCGNGADQFLNAKFTVVFLSLLSEGRIAEAVGASFWVPDAPEWMREPGRPFDQWRIDLLKFGGFDWEEVMLGTKRHAFLAAAGSEKAARQAITAFKKAQADPQETMFQWEKIAAFLAPEKRGDEDAADPRRAISVATQQEMLALLTEAVQDELPFRDLDRLMVLFEGLRRAETKDVLRRLRCHPSTTYAGWAGEVFGSMEESVPPTPPAPPVRFRVSLNGQWCRSTELGFGFVDAKWPSGSMVTTDAEGFAVIARDEFLDPPKRATRMAFHKGLPEADGSEKKKGGFYDRPWIRTEVAVPRVYDEVTVVNFTTGSLPIEIRYGSPPAPARLAFTTVTLLLADHTGPNDGGYELFFDGNAGEPSERMTLSAMSPGRYRVRVQAPGSARFLSEPFEVKQGMSPVKLQLEKGAHVYAEVQMPANARGAGEMELWRGEEEVTPQYLGGRYGDKFPPLFSGLPKGKYRLHLRSTAEFWRKHEMEKWDLDMAERVDCEGADVEFSVNDASPALLDLGRIEIKAVEGMKSKAGALQAVTVGAPK